MLIDVSKGELLDRISILEIKLEKVQDKEKILHIQNEYNELCKITSERSDELKGINTIIWNVENEIRKKEKNKEFDKDFIHLARLVYKWNDRRFEEKKKIETCEQKSLVTYDEKMPTMVIVSPMGFGDYLFINGLVREFAKRYNIVLGIADINVKNVPFMFRDLTNISYIVHDSKKQRGPMYQIAEIVKKMNVEEKLYLGYMKAYENYLVPQRFIGYTKGSEEEKEWAMKMYRNDANLDPKLMYDNFFILRDEEREEAFYKKVIEYLGTDKYIVVSDHSEHGKVDRRKIPENTLKEFLPGKGDSPVESDCIFDYKLVIERAQAFHGANGGFAAFTEFCANKVPKKYIHMYGNLGRTDALNYPQGYFRSEWVILR